MIADTPDKEMEMNTETAPQVEMVSELTALPNRREYDGNTGIFVRAKCEGKWGSHDIAELSADSLLNWLRSDGGCNALAENTLLALFNHEQIAQAALNARAGGDSSNQTTEELP